MTYLDDESAKSLVKRAAAAVVGVLQVHGAGAAGDVGWSGVALSDEVSAVLASLPLRHD